MKEKLITFETVKLAKEKGIDFRDWAGDWVNNGKAGTYHAYVTQSLLQKWLREEHDIHITIIPKQLPDNSIHYYSFEGKLKMNFDGLYPTYEECLEIRLQEALKLIEL